MESTTQYSNQNESPLISEFSAWVDDQKILGLVDMKFAVQSIATGNSSSRKVIEEFMRAEKMIAADILEAHLAE